MKNIKHPYGNKKSFILKSIKKLIQNLVRFFVNLVCKLDTHDEIIISSAKHAPKKKDTEFLLSLKHMKVVKYILCTLYYSKIF